MQQNDPVRCYDDNTGDEKKCNEVAKDHLDDSPWLQTDSSKLSHDYENTCTSPQQTGAPPYPCPESLPLNGVGK